MYQIIILSKKKLGSLTIFLPIFFSGGPKKISDPPRGQTKKIWDHIFFSCGCPYIVRKSQKNVYSFARSFLNGNILKNQWAVSAHPSCQIGLICLVIQSLYLPTLKHWEFLHPWMIPKKIFYHLTPSAAPQLLPCAPPPSQTEPCITVQLYSITLGTRRG